MKEKLSMKKSVKNIILVAIICIVVLLAISIGVFISSRNKDVITSTQNESEIITNNTENSNISNRRDELIEELKKSIEERTITWEQYSNDENRKASGGKSLSAMTNEEIEKEIEDNKKGTSQQKEYDNIFGEKIKKLEEDVKTRILSDYFNSYNEVKVQKVWIALDVSKSSIKYLYMFVSSSQSTNSNIIVRWDSENNELYRLNDYGIVEATKEATKIWENEDYIACISYENNDKKYTYMIRE